MSIHVMGTVAALLVGALAGLFACKRSSRWCPAHGAELLCAECLRQIRPGGRCVTCGQTWAAEGGGHRGDGR